MTGLPDGTTHTIAKLRYGRSVDGVPDTVERLRTYIQRLAQIKILISETNVCGLYC